MEHILYFAVSFVVSRIVFRHLSNRYGWKTTVWNKLFPKRLSRRWRMTIWITAALMAQVVVPMIFMPFGMEEPYLRVPVGIAFGFCFSVIPLHLPKQKDELL